MPSADLINIPETQDFAAAVRRYFDLNIEVIDTLFEAVPTEHRPACIKQAITMSFIAQNEPLLHWALNRGVDINAILKNDYGLCLELSDRLACHTRKEPQPAFVDIVQQAQALHGTELVLDVVGMAMKEFNSDKKNAEEAVSIVHRIARIFGEQNMRDPRISAAVFKASSYRSDKYEAIWALTKTDCLAESLRSTGTFGRIFRAVKEGDRGKLVKNLEKSLTQIIRNISDVEENESFLLNVIPHATPAILMAIQDNISARLRPLQHTDIICSLLHEVKDQDRLLDVPDFLPHLISTMTIQPAFGELVGASDVFRMQGKGWSLKATAALMNLEYSVHVERYDYDSISKAMKQHRSLLEETEYAALIDVLKKEIGYVLEKSLKRACREESHPDYLARLQDLPKAIKYEALITLATHEHALINQRKNGEPEADEVPLLTAARKLERSSGNTHHHLIPIMTYLMETIDDQFKLDLRPKDKRYARCLIMARHITDSRHYSLLTGKERDSLFSNDLGI